MKSAMALVAFIVLPFSLVTLVVWEASTQVDKFDFQVEAGSFMFKKEANLGDILGEEMVAIEVSQKNSTQKPSRKPSDKDTKNHLQRTKEL